ncbi:MAG TPA: Na+:solute symporter [Candidatus Krumholzibacteria bacterium]|nr:Na+:solute symporter [Candidatus Krumholzibacteria bacterium]HPD71040.1 Na+:solute symporter [Candidatus Krumholzibacteria bacterium]HRY39260.1 Na+:solute symporter [Candidatus Krumholzibacteria bacterium]
MQLDRLDALVIGLSLAAAFAPAVFFARKASRGTAEFFASGRDAPWWLAGTSMVATTFSTDTPNLVTDLVRNDGVAANWAWWAFLLTGMLTVFGFARLWRRSGTLTDLEFYELRYSGRAAAWVRGFRAVYLGLAFNAVIMGTVTLAAVKIANVMLGWQRLETVVFCAALCIGFSVMSGLWGVLVSDLVQFVIAMAGVTVAAVFALRHPAVGGLAGLLAQLDPATINLLPAWSDGEALVTLLVIPLAVQWWAVWYPGAEPGGGSYVAQRMLAARNERHALGATLWFNVAHYALRPWPWIIVALASIVVFPDLADISVALPDLDPALLGHDIAYPAMLTFLPHGLLGLLVAALLAAYVSTMSTHLNWGASYLVHDLYRRFLRPGRSERHYVRVSRWTTALLMMVASCVVFLIDTAGEGFRLLLSIGAGTGLLYLLRWYWWRVNAWSEIAAMATSFATATVLATTALAAHWALLVTVAVTTAAWLVVAVATPPTDPARLVAFYRRVRPAGPGWREVRAAAGAAAPADSIPLALLGWSLGCLVVYAALFGTGNLLFGRTGAGVAMFALAAAGGVALWRVVRSLLR